MVCPPESAGGILRAPLCRVGVTCGRTAANHDEHSPVRVDFAGVDFCLWELGVADPRRMRL